MMRMIFPFVVLVLGLWAWNLFAGPGAGSPWAVYDQSLLLSGLLSIALMSLAMMLALRPAWLERPLGGLDQIYRTHKWAGILAVVFAEMNISDKISLRICGNGVYEGKA